MESNGILYSGNLQTKEKRLEILLDLWPISITCQVRPYTYKPDC